MDFNILRKAFPDSDWDVIEKAFDKFNGRNYARLLDLIPEDYDKIKFIFALMEMVDEDMLKVVYCIKKGNLILEKKYIEPTDIPDIIEFEGKQCPLSEFDIVCGFSW